MLWLCLPREDVERIETALSVLAAQAPIPSHHLHEEDGIGEATHVRHLLDRMTLLLRDHPE